MICSTTVRRVVAATGAACLLATPALTTPSAAGAESASRVVRSSHHVPWHPNATVNVVKTIGTRTYLGGGFTRLLSSTRGSVTRVRLAALSSRTGAVVRGFHASVNGTVRAISVFDGKVFIGGDFTKVNGTARAHLAALRLTDGRLAATPNIRVEGPVLTLLHLRDRLYVGGDFQLVNGVSRTKLFAVTTAGAVANDWPASPVGTKGGVYVLAAAPDHHSVLVGGAFHVLVGLPRTFLGRITLQGRVTSWAPAPDCATNCFVLDLTAAKDTVYAGSAGPGGRATAYRLSGGSRRWHVHTSGDVSAIALDGRRLLVGGHFEKVAGHLRPLFAELSTATGAVLTHRVAASGPLYPGILDIDRHRGLTLLGGAFQTINGQHRLARIRP